MADAEGLVGEYPWLEEIYREMAAYMSEPKEVLNIFSEALKIMDRNTVQYMIEEQMDQIKEQKEQIDTQQAQIDTQQAQLLQKDAEIARLKRLLQEKPGIREPF